jgi:hypothetical protein
MAYKSEGRSLIRRKEETTDEALREESGKVIQEYKITCEVIQNFYLPLIAV